MVDSLNAEKEIDINRYVNVVADGRRFTNGAKRRS